MIRGVDKLDHHRVEEILESPEKIEVLYEGKSVWINNLNADKQTAEVTINENSKKINVPVEKLVELH